MKSPRLRAEVMILNEDHSKVLVQCDLRETFYRFPGTLIHRGIVKERVINEIRYKEYEDIILIWKSINKLKERPTYPEEIVSYLEENKRNIVHSISKNK
ncbi:hypothetical protein [Bacillus wiedmannii]|uniref:hypothetical protein n=1 Tax=Bacillus wiedmannii TaxID=1890302 RepID=UPI000BEB3D74|nr:hypothetical protein [Bacillus wiedmannii]PEA78174.1 hypothetical protein CON92_10835 [Bacillus wiedmannii]